MSKKQAKDKKAPTTLKTLAGLLFGLLFVAAIAYCIGWGVTGSYNPAEWVKSGSATETPAKPVENGASIHTHALSASSQSDDKAAFDVAVNQWIADNDPEDDSDDGSYVDLSLSTILGDFVKIQNNLEDKIYSLTDFDINYAIINEYTYDGNEGYDNYFLIIDVNDIFYGYELLGFTGMKLLNSVFNNYNNSSLGYLDYKIYAFNSWNSDDTVTITFNLARATVPLPDDPVKEGYHFVGWYLDEEFTQAYDNSPIYEDTQLYAKFEINVYTVTFDSAGGNEVESITVDWNTVITPTELEKTGYNFLGWYLTDGTKYEGQTIKEDITLTAHWEIKRFTVLFYVEGELYTTVTVDYGTNLGAVADVAEVFLNNIVSFANVNGETPEVTADKMTVSDDMIVVANKPSTFEKIWKYKYTPYIIGGVCAIVALGVAVTVIEKKKKQV